MDSERRYRALFDHSNDAIFIINMKGTILLANQPATTLLGAPLSQILNKPLTQYIKLTEMLTIHQQIRQLLSGNTPPIAEQTLIAADGTEIPIEMSVTLVQDGAGQPLSLQMVARDIRERKRTQGVITSERYLLRTLFDSMPDSIFTIDRDGTYTLVNEAHLRRLGLSSADDFIGKQADDFYDPDTAQIMNKRSMKVIDADEPDNNFEEQRGPDTWYMVTRAPLHDESGGVSGALIVERDISEIKIVQDELHRRLEQLTILRQADEEVAHSLNMESVGLIALDAALRLSRADAGYIAVLEKNEDLDIEPILRVSHMIGGYNRFTVGDTLPQNGIVGRAIEYRESQLVLDVRLDADYIPDVVNTQSVMALPIIVQEEFLGVIQLVSRQKDVFTQDTFQFISLLAYRIAIALDNARLYEVAQQQLQQVLILNESLRDLEEIKTDMIRIASHDLKNPLGIIDGYLNMLDMDRENFAPIYLEYFEAMQRAVHRMNTILSDILSLERVQQRAAGTYTISVDLYSLVVKALEEFTPYFKNKAQNITIDSPESQALVLGDEAQLYEAISNLISNAIKYTPEGGNIAVRLYYDDNLWMFEVQDDGYGIPEDRQKNLFEAFYRAKAQGTEQIEGTGLGLHLVKNIIERHGGEMFFHSIYQHGSLFGFRLQPANSVNNGQSHDRDTLPENEAQGEANANPPTFFDD
jgi:two-component system phosphate regulon sensor histidine kinase PhoR